MRSKTFGGGHSSGGGGGRDHPAQPIADDTISRFNAEYVKARRDCEAVLNRHFGGGHSSGGGGGRIRVGHETKQSMALKRMFSGLNWFLVRGQIIYLMYRANVAAMRIINDVLKQAFAEGANRAEYELKHEAEYYPLPYTEAVVATLARDHLLDIPTRSVDRAKDTEWLRRTLSSIIAAERLADTSVDDLPADIARRLTLRCEQSMSTTALAMIYGVFDYGMFLAGLEALDAGLDVEKTWLSILDDRVRDSHRHLHGTTLPMRQRFRGFYGLLRFPHDPKAPPAEIYNCRCRMAVHLAGHSPKTPIGPLHGDDLRAYKRWRDETIDALGGELALAMAHRRRLNGIQRQD